MRKGENPKKFLARTSEMLRELEKLLQAPKGSISFVNSSILFPCTIYRKSAVNVGDEIFDFVLSGTSDSANLLLCRVIDVLVEFYQNFSYPSKEGRWFYNYAKKKDDSPENLAKVIYQEIFCRLSEFYGGTLGIDFDIMTALAEEAYEKDAAIGHLFFYTGELSQVQLKEWCIPTFYRCVPLCEKNIRHIRKLLAGTGNDKNSSAGNSGLLFVRDTDGDKYKCTGYIREKFYKEILASVYIDGKGGWKFNINGQVSFCVKDNRAFFPPSRLEGIRKKIENELGVRYGNLFHVLEALSAQGHGTSVVFLDLDKQGSFARRRMQNLENQGRAVAVEPISLESVESDRELQCVLKNLSRVDGAIVVNYPKNQICYTNVIVDGKAVISGRPDAGARHNALRAFVADLSRGCVDDPQPTLLACIFSEDGGVSVETASECRKVMEIESASSNMTCI